MKRNSHLFFRILPLLLGMAFIAAPFSVRGKQAPPQPSRAGIYEGHVFAGETLRLRDRVYPFHKVILEFNDDLESSDSGQDRYAVRGQIFDMTKERIKVMDSLKGWFWVDANKVNVDIVNDPLIFFEGGFEKDKDGNEYLSLRSYGSSRQDELILFRQEKPPPKVSQGNLTIEAAVVEPLETEPGKPVTLKYECRATDIIDTAIIFQESLTITCPDGSLFEEKGTYGPDDWQHRDGFCMDGHGKRERSVTASKPGSYKCRIELKATGYATSVVREVSFTVKPDSSQTGMGTTTGANTGTAAIPPGTPIWVLKKVEIDPQKIAEKDAKKPERERAHWQVSANRASAEFQAPIGNPNDGPRMQVSLTFGGAVPAVLRPGDKFDVTMTPKAGPEKNISGGVGIEGRVGADGLKVTRTPADAFEGAGAFSFGFSPGQQITYHCEVPKDLNPRDRSELTVSRILFGHGCLAVSHYVADVASATTPAAGSQGSTADNNATGSSGTGPQVVVGPAGGGAAGKNLKAWLASPTVVLVPGEPSQINGVYVSGWRNNTADRVEVDMEVVDNWGSLKVNPKIVAAPGPTSADPGNMSSGEHYFSEMWSARIGARPGMFRVPIIVRQKGAGAVAVTLTACVMPKFTRVPGTGKSVGASPAAASKASEKPNALEARPSLQGISVRVGFDELKLGDIKGDEFSTVGLRLTATKGRLHVLPAQLPAMVMPAGQAQVLVVNGDRVTEFAMEFNPPVKSFTITLPGLRGGASFPTYSITAFNPSGASFDMVGQEHWIPTVPEPARIALNKGMMSRAVISVDNRFGNTAWATYNCLPIVEIELQR